MLGKNSGGNQVVLAASINDDTGAALTVAAAATPGTLLHASLYTQSANTSGGGLTFDGTTGLVTVADQSGVGTYLVTAVAGNAIGANAANYAVGIYKGATLQGVEARKVEPATAIQSAVGPAVAIVTLALADTLSARIRVGTNGDSVTFRDFALVMQKIDG